MPPTKFEILNYNDDKLKQWIDVKCGKKLFQYDEDIIIKLLPRFRKIIKKSYKPRIDLLFKQPFQFDFGLNPKGQPEPTFWKFLNDKDSLTKTLNFLQTSLHENKILNISNSTSSSCKIGYYTCVYIKNNNIIFDEDGNCLGNMTPYFFNKIREKDIRECIKHNNKLYINFSYHINDAEFGHVIGIYLDFEKKRYYAIDSAYGKINDIRVRTILKIFNDNFNYKFNVRITIKPFVIKEFGLCPSVQGQYDTCAVWTYYSILTHLQNPEMKYINIYKELIKYSEKDRQHLLLRFMYYIFTTNIDRILFFTIKSRPNIPEW